MAIGLTPLILWTVFSLVYYGFPLPNTYYAKLGTGVSKPFLWSHGVAYYLNAIRSDRLVLLVPLAAGLAVRFRRRSLEMTLIGGIALYFLYIASIGGDFMSGRFFTAPLVLAVALLGSMDEAWNDSRRRAFVGAFAGVIAVGLTVRCPTLTPDPPGYGVVDADALFDAGGVSDERGYYSPTTGLFHVHPSHLLPQHPLALKGLEDGQRGVKVSVQGSTGFYGYWAGPGVYVVDPLALSDPLLARLPVGVERPRTGHNERRIPFGYLASLESGTNQIADPKLHRYYDRLKLVTSGPIFSGARWREIIALNFSAAGKDIDRAFYRRPQPERIETMPVDDGEGVLVWWPKAAKEVPLGGIVVHLPQPEHRALVVVGLEARGAFKVSLLRVGAPMYTAPDIETDGHGISWATIPVPPEVVAGGYDGIQIEMSYAYEGAKLAGVRLSSLRD
jgi:arabinofuranosyltransferase